MTTFVELRVGQYFQANIDCYTCCLWCKIDEHRAVVVSDPFFGECNNRMLAIKPEEKVSSFTIITPLGMPGFVIFNATHGFEARVKFQGKSSSGRDKRKPTCQITYERARKVKS